VLDRYSDARRDAFIHRASPQAIANKRLIFHANGGGQALEEAVAGLRRLASDPPFLLKRLMFTDRWRHHRWLEPPSGKFRVTGPVKTGVLALAAHYVTAFHPCGHPQPGSRA